MDYVQDKFNLTDLNEKVSHHWEALCIILDMETYSGLENDIPGELVDKDARTLYGLIHAWYIHTKRGIRQMVSINRMPI